jgi:hypothetical protein
MNRKSIFDFIAVVALVAAMAAGWYNTRIISRLADEQDAVERDCANLRGQINRWKLDLQSARKQEARPRSAAPSEPPAPSQRGPRSTIAERLRSDPQLQLLWLADRKATLASMYAPLFRSLSLTSEQQAAFLELAIAREEKDFDLMNIRGDSNVRENGTAVSELRTQADVEMKMGEKQLLGPDGFEKLQAYVRMAPARDLVSDFAGTASLSGIPMNSEQAEQLVQLVANASAKFNNGSNVSGFDIDWNQVDANASQLLSPAQLNLLKTALTNGVSTPGRQIVQLRAIANDAAKGDILPPVP